MNQTQNKTLFAPQEEEKKHKYKERNNLIIGAIIFILMLPVDYIVTEKARVYGSHKTTQKDAATIIINHKPAQQHEGILDTAVEPTVTPQNKFIQTNQTNRPADGWLEVDGKRYIIDGRTIIKTK